MTSDPTARTGWTGANQRSAPPAPMASTTSLLQTGQPTANSDSRPPPVATVALRSPCWTRGRRWVAVVSPSRTAEAANTG